MAQTFHRSSNYISRGSIIVLLGLLVLLVGGAAELQRSDWVTGAAQALEQPVPFSHQHHVAGLGIDCRYCHVSVEESRVAGVPPTKTCMNCHSQIWAQAPMLEPVRASFREQTPIQWRRVHDLPDFTYFQHDIHVAKGIGCQSCHGPIHEMPLTWQHASLQMEWCLDCHRSPEKHVRPVEQVFNMLYEQPRRDRPVVFEGREYTSQAELGRELAQRYRIRTPGELTSCSMCHR